MHTSNTENREQTFEEKLDEILWELTDQSGWDLIGITQEQADALSEQLRSDRVEAKQAIKTLVLEDVVGEDVDKDNWGWKNYTDSIRAINIILAEQRRIINPQKEVRDE